MSSTTIFCDFELACAHVLPNVPADHKCGRMHGHNYRVRVHVAGDVDPVLGWVVDYDVVDRVWNAAVRDRLCHRTLNDIMPNPTAELLAEWIAAEMQAGITRGAVTKVEVMETGRFGVVWESGVDRG